jgi:predicted dehydrogenase
MRSIGVAIVGAGAIALTNHLPGIAMSPGARLVALCDADAAVLARAKAQSGGSAATFTDYHALLSHPNVDAIIVATPNHLHAPITLAAVAAGKHVLCEKPLALDLPTATTMYQQAQSAGVRHMTAFTYRFVPAMRYLHHLVQDGAVGQPFHFRAQRFQDWATRDLGWRQVRALAGTGEMGDMLSHRIDYAHLLLGPIRRLVADTRRFIDQRDGKPADVDDWVAMLTEFVGGATGVLESTKLATGRGQGYGGQDLVEINGDAGTLLYSTQRPMTLLVARRGSTDLQTVQVPDQFRVWPGSPRDPSAGDPVVTFRYDQDFEFIDAIRNDRPCRPSFREGVAVQAVMDAALRSVAQRQWVAVADATPSLPAET